MITIDYALLAMWLVLSIRNNAALLPLFCLLADCFLWSNLGGFERCCITAAIYYMLSTFSNITAKLRYAMLAAGSLYWMGAADELIYTVLNLETVYYDVMPYLVIGLNAYIATVIFMDGGRNIGRVMGRFSRFANRWRFGL